MSSDSLPGRSMSSGKVIKDKDGLILQPIRRDQNEQTGGGPLSTVAVMAVCVLTVLWCYYAGFGLLWLELFTQMGDDLLWAYFGLFTVVASSMGVGVTFSMRAQRVGWWAKGKEKRDSRGQCCGFQLY